jgi:glutamine amidotransferase
MCRLYGFRANEPTKVECTLVLAQNALLRQSRADRRGKSHPDGWGICSYHDGRPDLERRAVAAFADAHFSVTAERTYAETVLAHVRMATVGAVRAENTHPFAHGPWSFAHNGTVTAFAALEGPMAAETGPRLQAHRSGATDSEQLFYWLLGRMERAGIPADVPCSDLPALKRVVTASLAELASRCERAGAREPARLNLLLTDGSVLLATCWNHTLWWVHREGVHDCEICGIPHVCHDPSTEYRAVVVASEPISHEDWRAVPAASLLAVDAAIGTTIEPIAAPAEAGPRPAA